LGFFHELSFSFFSGCTTKGAFVPVADSFFFILPSFCFFRSQDKKHDRGFLFSPARPPPRLESPGILNTPASFKAVVHPTNFPLILLGDVLAVSSVVFPPSGSLLLFNTRMEAALIKEALPSHVIFPQPVRISFFFFHATRPHVCNPPSPPRGTAPFVRLNPPGPPLDRDFSFLFLTPFFDQLPGSLPRLSSLLTLFTSMSQRALWYGISPGWPGFSPPGLFAPPPPPPIFSIVLFSF